MVFDAKAEQTFLQWSKEITLLNGVFQGKDQLTQRDLQSAELGDKSWKLSCSDDRPPALAVKTAGAVFALRSGQAIEELTKHTLDIGARARLVVEATDHPSSGSFGASVATPSRPGRRRTAPFACVARRPA